MDKIRDRLKIFIKSQNITVKAFEKIIGASNGYVNNIKNSMGREKLDVILEIYPNLSIEWLYTGLGRMLKKNNVYERKNSSSNLQVGEPEAEYGNSNRELAGLKSEIILKDEIIELQKEAINNKENSKKIEEKIDVLIQKIELLQLTVEALNKIDGIAKIKK